MHGSLASVSDQLALKRAEATAAHEAYLGMSGDESDASFLTAYNAAVAKATRLDGEVDALVKQASDLIVAGGGGSVADGGLRLGFDAQEIENQRRELLSGRRTRIGATAVDSTTAPMGAVADYQISTVFPFLRERPSVAGIFPTETADRDSVVVYRASAAASAAAPVAKGDTKPLSSPAWEGVTTQMEVIAHRATIDNRIVADYDGWLNLVGTELIAGLLEKVDSQVLSGDGTSPDLAGLLKSGNGIGSYDRDATNETRTDAILQGLTVVRNAAYLDPTYLIIHPSDLRDVMLEKATSAGTYLNGGPSEAGLRTLWGLQVVPTTAIDRYTAVVLNPEAAGRFIVRQAPTLDANPWSETEFKANEVALRCETRVGFALIRAAAVCKVLL